MRNISIIVNAILIIAVAYLYYLNFFNKDKKEDKIKTSDKNSIAYINTDTIWSKYKFVETKKIELEQAEMNMQAQYDAKEKAWEKEYQNYIKEGTSGKLTLAQQKQKEEELGKKREQLAEYDKNLSAELLQLQQTLNNQIQDSILAYIKKYNKIHSFEYILGYSKNGGILFADDKNDITKNILEGLNSGYKK